MGVTSSVSPTLTVRDVIWNLAYRVAVLSLSVPKKKTVIFVHAVFAGPKENFDPMQTLSWPSAVGAPQ